MPKPKTHDEYIAQAPAFARPILKKLRKVMHKACPGVEESIKWGHAHYASDGMLAAMSAHKAHVNFSFWRGEEMDDPEGLLGIVGKSSIGNMRLESLADVPSERVLAAYVKEALRVNASIKSAPKKKAARKTNKQAARSLQAPPDLAAALKKNAAARKTFEGFSPSNRKDYVEWLMEAKREETRAKRLQQALEWMAEGKPRNWKYMPKWR